MRRRGRRSPELDKLHKLPPVDVAAGLRARLEAELGRLGGMVAPGTIVARRGLPGVPPLVQGGLDGDLRLVATEVLVDDTWPWPLPLTWGALMAEAEAEAAQTCADMLAEVQRGLELTVPDLRPGVAARDLTSRWPWPTSAAALRVLLSKIDADPRFSWPAEAAPAAVAAWAYDALERAEPGTGADLLRVVETGWRAQRIDLPGGGLPFAGLALLYLAEQDVRRGLQRPAIAVDAGRVHHDLVRSWGTVDRDGVRHRAAPADLDTSEDGLRVELLGAGGHVQLELPYGESWGEALIQLLRRLRGDEGLRHWTALLRLWSVEGKRRGSVRWMLDDHLRALGLRPDDLEARRAIAAQVAAMTQVEVVVYGKDGGQRSRAPLVLVGRRYERIDGAGWAMEGLELLPNPLLYEGVRTTEGSLGTNWAPAPVELAMVSPASHPGLQGLGLVLTMRLRWDTGRGLDGSTYTGRSLLELAGIKVSRAHPGRAWARLERLLRKLSEIESLVYRWEAPPAADAICRIWPAAWQADRLQRGLARHVEERPSDQLLPRTGAELASWRADRGLSQRELAASLGLSFRQVQYAESPGRRAAALPRDVAEAIRSREPPSGRADTSWRHKKPG